MAAREGGGGGLAVIDEMTKTELFARNGQFLHSEYLGEDVRGAATDEVWETLVGLKMRTLE